MQNQHFTTPPDSLKETEFMMQFGGIYEHSPWVAEARAIAVIQMGKPGEFVRRAAVQTSACLLRA